MEVEKVFSLGTIEGRSFMKLSRPAPTFQPQKMAYNNHFECNFHIFELEHISTVFSAYLCNFTDLRLFHILHLPMLKLFGTLLFIADITTRLVEAGLPK